MITIDPQEVSAELAERQLIKDVINFNKGKTEKEYNNMIYVEDAEGNCTYTEQAQDIFNDYYDEYYSLMMDLKQ